MTAKAKKLTHEEFASLLAVGHAAANRSYGGIWVMTV
ncbi:hypothetical protein ACVI1J_000914 [Bradyrhizobium diazoefficiens]